MNPKTRFDSIQTRAVALVREAGVLLQACNLPVVADQALLAKAFTARLLTGVMKSNAHTAFFALRKAVGGEVVIGELDYERFQERVTGIAGAEALSWNAIADGIMTAAEVLLRGGDEAERLARELLA